AVVAQLHLLPAIVDEGEVRGTIPGFEPFAHRPNLPPHGTRARPPPGPKGYRTAGCDGRGGTGGRVAWRTSKAPRTSNARSKRRAHPLPPRWTSWWREPVPRGSCKPRR